ncbi:MAG: RDD family protein [Saccharospirillaceae bacterium]|nr:RDD family protein [Pseudomonadales bacterium]NRB81632.1 RDD family protein [Saccharospirillaceae bacterium]
MENNLYTPPSAELHSADENLTEVELASRWSRLFASLIDGLVMAIFTVPLMYFTGGFDGLKEGIQPGLIYTLAIALVGIIVFIIIHGYFLINTGQTIGKKILSIQIVTLDNQQVTLNVLLKRYGFFFGIPQIPVVGPFINGVSLLFIFSESKRCLHDHVGGTKVINLN